MMGTAVTNKRNLVVREVQLKVVHSTATALPVLRDDQDTMAPCTSLALFLTCCKACEAQPC
jgi:hypothetical protein